MVNVVSHAGQLFGNDRLLVDVGDLIFMLVRKPVGEAETLALWREATVGETHAHRDDSDNVTITPERGNGKSYTLSRLKREAPAATRNLLEVWSILASRRRPRSVWLACPTKRYRSSLS